MNTDTRNFAGHTGPFKARICDGGTSALIFKEVEGSFSGEMTPAEHEANFRLCTAAVDLLRERNELRAALERVQRYMRGNDWWDHGTLRAENGQTNLTCESLVSELLTRCGQ